MGQIRRRTDEETTFGAWSAREAIAEMMVPLIGRLYRRNGVVTTVYGRPLVNQSVIGILKAHRFARRVDGTELALERTLPLLQELDRMDPAPASIDLARLVAGLSGQQDLSLEQYLTAELAEVLGSHRPHRRPPTDVVLFGFGRIGRLLARILIEHQGDGTGLRLRAIVVRGRGDLAKRASLLRRDSVHGPFAGTIAVDETASTITANGTVIHVIPADDPGVVDYTAYGIADAIIVDNTGRLRDLKGLSRHLHSPGAARVLLTAPGTGGVRNVVHGINHQDLSDDDRVVAAASCTTNAVTPVLKALDDRFGILRGHIETVHSFTNDQNLTDNFHKGERRGRSAVLNMVLTETGAARAVTEALPSLAGRLTGNAIRVPTPDVSLAVLHLTLKEPVEKMTLNAYLRGVSLDSPLQRQVDYIDSPEVVSTDFIGSRRAGVVDGLATIATGDDQVVVYVWYDNEYGYSSQVVRLLESMSGAHPPVLPHRTEDAAMAPVPSRFHESMGLAVAAV